MPKKQDFSKKILKILAEKPAISLPELRNKILKITTPSSRHPSSIRRGNQAPLLIEEGVGGGDSSYAITRSLKGLKEAGLIESLNSGQNDYARLTKAGRMKANSYKLEAKSSLVDPSWDGKWRIILLDLPESRKSERESLRYLLKKAGFVCLKNSAWISPYPFEHLFLNIKKDLGLESELMIITTSTLDEVTENFFFKNFRK